ncbi:hypothetical protein H4582DRAFT_2148324 [Lactarius indigo]|nr:hypothetical protein H4582DRAFT_2148324 [Lactarius indigo]
MSEFQQAFKVALTRRSSAESWTASPWASHWKLLASTDCDFEYSSIGVNTSTTLDDDQGDDFGTPERSLNRARQVPFKVPFALSDRHEKVFSLVVAVLNSVAELEIHKGYKFVAVYAEICAENNTYKPDAHAGTALHHTHHCVRPNARRPGPDSLTADVIVVTEVNLFNYSGLPPYPTHLLGSYRLTRANSSGIVFRTMKRLYACGATTSSRPQDDIWLRPDGHVGFDAGTIICVKPGDDDSLWLSAWKVIGRSFCGSPSQIPLTTNSPDDLSWLAPISVPIPPETPPPGSIWCARPGTVAIPSLKLQFPMPTSEAIRGSGVRGEVSRSHKPSRALQLFTTSDLVYLTHLSLTSGTHNPTTEASVIIVNHLPTSVTFIAPSFPFVAWILAPSNDTTLAPLAFITSASSTPHSSKSYTLVEWQHPPHFAHRSTRTLIADIRLPLPGRPSDHHRDSSEFSTVFHNITIEAWRFNPSVTMLPSGIVHARLSLPAGMDIAISPNQMLPGSHIFDGPPPVQPTTFPPLPIPNTNLDDDVPPPALLLPIPLPPRAFAGLPEHLARCADRANGDRCERGSMMLRVSARSADVTLEVLPGREREFCSFVGKVIWGAGESVITSIHGGCGSQRAG